MAVQHTSFILKVLNGFNAGAVVRLKTGSLVIGSSMNSDIILHDENIADQHVQLLITPSSITLQPLARPVFVDGAEMAEESVDLLAFQTVRLGKVEFQVTDARKATSKSVTESTAVSRAADPKKQAADKAESPAGQKKMKAMPVKPPAKAGWSGRVWLMLGLGLLLLANLIYWAPQFNRLLESFGMLAPAEKRAATLMDELGQRDFKLINETDGSVSVEGYTHSAEERNELLSRIQGANINTRLRIWAQDEMVDNASMICRAMGEPKVVIKPGKAGGELVAEGFVSKTAAWDQVRASILNDVGGVRSVADEALQSMDSYLASFVQLIEKKGLSSRIQATTDGKKVIVNGELTQLEIEKLKAMRDEFLDVHKNGPAIVLEVTDVRNRIRLAIRSVSVGKVPFLVAKDGKKYMEGSALGENYFVKSIKPDHVVLTNNGVDIPFYYGIEEKNNGNVVH
ncbi:type III secretion system inner membrane ring subunit SctD [Candidatus Thiothrix sp. Deng01]|uniref:Type III secretion system inner membrane ring subunit SctD n=1 Tax=Candidatus Thiothrix phosphatis TaxID=3112415 RepID=A0ABU6CSQ5_9GAMM|nr:type III secretion system inner membrane ring subunit SctD [Candidatus Thiothrix sp. Deng01]MEB4589418.1 type III secretion system inner membrane ring subunit SctD [Candidatus Thiothrix sp. Deng01]